MNITHTKYFNQRLLNYTQRFASDPNYIFFAHNVSQKLNLKSRINIALKKVAGNNLTAGMIRANFKDTVKSFVANDEAYTFMNTLKGTPAYWKHTLGDILAMARQLNLISHFMSLSCADLQWNELVVIISKLNGQDISLEEASNLTYQERCKILNSNPVLVARLFQYRVESFFKEIIRDDK